MARKSNKPKAAAQNNTGGGVKLDTERPRSAASASSLPSHLASKRKPSLSGDTSSAPKPSQLDTKRSSIAPHKQTKRPRPPTAPKTHGVASEPLTSTSQILPEHLSSLTNKYSLNPIYINSSTRISSKTATVLSLLCDAELSSSQNLVALTAKAPAGNKLISIAEIAKREMQARGMKWWQYTRVYGRLEEFEEEIPPESESRKRKRDDGFVEGEDNNEIDRETKNAGVNDNDEDAFESMVQGRKKVRSVPVITIYLTSVPIPEMKMEFGEQAG